MTNKEERIKMLISQYLIRAKIYLRYSKNKN